MSAIILYLVVVKILIYHENNWVWAQSFFIHLWTITLNIKAHSSVLSQRWHSLQLDRTVRTAVYTVRSVSDLGTYKRSHRDHLQQNRNSGPTARTDRSLVWTGPFRRWGTRQGNIPLQPLILVELNVCLKKTQNIKVKSSTIYISQSFLSVFVYFEDKTCIFVVQICRDRSDSRAGPFKPRTVRADRARDQLSRLLLGQDRTRTV